MQVFLIETFLGGSSRKYSNEDEAVIWARELQLEKVLNSNTIERLRSIRAAGKGQIDWSTLETGGDQTFHKLCLTEDQIFLVSSVDEFDSMLSYLKIQVSLTKSLATNLVSIEKCSTTIFSFNWLSIANSPPSSSLRLL